MLFYSITGILFGVFLVYRIACIFYPQPDLGGVEVNIIYFVQRLLDHQPLYADPEQAPFSIAQYGPLYYYLVAGVARGVGLSADNVYELFVVSRIVSLLLNLAFVGVVFRFARKIAGIATGPAFAIGVASFLFLEITSYSRPDSLNHLLFFISLYLFARGVREEKKITHPVFIVSLLLAAISLLAKQSSIILPALFGSWLLWDRRYKDLLWICVYYLVGLGIVAGILQWTTGWSLYCHNAIRGVNNGVSLVWFKGVIVNDLYYHFGMFFVAAFIVILVRLRREKDKLSGFFFVSLIILFVFANAIASKFGSNIGYFTEWWTMLFIAIGYCWPGLRKGWPEALRKVPAILVLTVLCTKTILLVRPLYKMTSEKPAAAQWKKYRDEKALADWLLARLHPGEQYVVFTNFYTAESYLGCFLFRHAVMPQMDIVGLAAYRRKEYDYTHFIAALKSGAFPWLIMRTDVPHKKFFEHDLNRYQLVATTNEYLIYQFE